MKIVLQRVAKASVDVDNKQVSAIGRGLLLLVGFGDDDDQAGIEKAVKKIVNLRLWPGDQNRGFDNSVLDVSGEVLIVPQFTLMANCSRGNRPDFGRAKNPREARRLYNVFVEKFMQYIKVVKTGVFGEMMEVELVNEGPVTLVLDF
ncbi:D-tyrosyl-tRNA(Tyr) deacylase [Patescibacteria group bacterium]|nr:D-tyrosyl-tRNA(Tyr) deacylase [Patescibacteria group bacterium]